MEDDFLEAMEAVGEEFKFDLPEGDINPFDKSLINGLLKKIHFPQSHHAEGFIKLKTNLAKFVPSITVRLGKYNCSKKNLRVIFFFIHTFEKFCRQ